MPCSPAGNLSAPGLNGGKPKPVPQALKVLSDGALIIAFICTFVFAMFYPNYLSISWMLIPGLASFVNIQTLRKLMFPFLTFVFTITFVAQAITTFNLFEPPEEDGVEYRMAFLHLFGLYKYPNDFTFTACGFYIICLLGQIGKITHGKASLPKGKEVSFDTSSDTTKSINDSEYEFDDIDDFCFSMRPYFEKFVSSEQRLKMA